MCHASSADCRLFDLFKNALAIFQKYLARRAYFNASWQTLKQLKTDLIFQILNLPCQRWLSNTKPFCSASIMLLLSNRNEIAQLPEFHTHIIS